MIHIFFLSLTCRSAPGKGYRPWWPSPGRRPPGISGHVSPSCSLVPSWIGAGSRAGAGTVPDTPVMGRKIQLNADSSVLLLKKWEKRCLKGHFI